MAGLSMLGGAGVRIFEPAGCTRRVSSAISRPPVATMTRPKIEEERSMNRSATTSSSTSSAARQVLISKGPVRRPAKKHTSEESRVSVRDYMVQSMDLVEQDDGPPRWFCPAECGEPTQKNAPVLMFLPGMEGTGLGLLLHHRKLGDLFEVRCLHIPVKDRTPFQGLLKVIEDAVKEEQRQRPSSPVYLLGDSFGAVLALAVAARNPKLDLVLVLANPATSIDRSQLQPLFPLLGALPDDVFQFVPYFLSFTMGDPVRMASAAVDKNFQDPWRTAQDLANSLTSLLPTLPNLGKIIPRETLTWKLNLIRTGARYVNSRLHAVRAQVLILASEKDQLLPSKDEAKRLNEALKNSKVRLFKDSGHTLLLEDGLDLATTIKATLFYRRSKQRDVVEDYVPPTREEFMKVYEGGRILRHLVSPVFFSTNEQGKVIKGLAGVPDDRPIVFVGNHMLMGLELSLFVGELFKQRSVLARGLAHPLLFSQEMETQYWDKNFIDQVGLFGAVPVSGKNFYKLLANNFSVLLYPGGAREALHKKGEEYQLFWPEKSEFVRMAARFGVTIVPFSCVGEDDIFQLVMDFDDLKVNSFLRERLVLTESSTLRPESHGEVAKQPLFLPVLAPKVPGRFYLICGQPISTEGVKDRQKADEIYMQVKAQVQSGLSYLLRKRDEDPYRQVLPRLIYEASWAGTRQGPSFDI